MKQSKIVTKKRIIIIAIVILVLILSLCLFKSIRQNQIKKTTINYTSADDFKTVEEVLVYKECKFIKQEKSNTDNFNYDIYLEFKEDLFTGSKSNKEYFEHTIGLIAKVLNNSNFILIDNSKNIVIEVTCNVDERDIEKIVINGDTSYFEHEETKNSLQNYNEIRTTDIEIQSPELKKIIEANWIYSKLNLGTIESTEDKYDIYSEEGFEVRTVYKKVFNIVFTDKYKETVVNDIKVGTDNKTIIEKMGTPTFETNRFIGYKGKEIYVFFTENEISIYRVEKFETKEFENFIKEFDMNTVRKTVSNLTDIWPDYDEYKNNEEYIEVTYSLKGIKVQINVTNEQGILVYNNYTGNLINEKTIQEIDEEELPKYVYMKLDNDLVYMKELERIVTIENEQYIQSLKSE